MLSLKYKDLKNRKLFFRQEKKKKLYKFLFVNLISRNTKSIELYTSFLKLQKQINKISKTKIKSRCGLTNRSNSVSKHYNLSRIKLREFMQFGILSGFTKSAW